MNLYTWKLVGDDKVFIFSSVATSKDSAVSTILSSLKGIKQGELERNHIHEIESSLPGEPYSVTYLPGYEADPTNLVFPNNERVVIKDEKSGKFYWVDLLQALENTAPLVVQEIRPGVCVIASVQTD